MSAKFPVVPCNKPLLPIQVALVSLETFAVVALPTARGAVAIAVQHTNHLPVLLAVAIKHTKGRCKVLVMNILPGANVTGGHQPAVLVAQVSCYVCYVCFGRSYVNIVCYFLLQLFVRVSLTSSSADGQ